MRYTTIIDLTELPGIWKNSNATLLYYYLAMKCGYNDEDRDFIRCSLRILALRTGLSFSAVRHALAILQKQGLIARKNDGWMIRKFVLEKKPTPRTQKTASQGAAQHEEIMRQQQMKREEDSRKFHAQVEARNAWLQKATKEELAAAIRKIEESSGSFTWINKEVFILKAQLVELKEILKQK